MSELQARIILQTCLAHPECPDPTELLNPIIFAISEKIRQLNDVNLAKIQSGGSNSYEHKYMKYKAKYNQAK